LRKNADENPRFVFIEAVDNDIDGELNSEREEWKMRAKSIVVFSVSLSFLMMANVLLAANEDLFERAP